MSELNEDLVMDLVMDRLYWFFKMVDSGGPDGSDLDAAVADDAREAVAWYEHLIAIEGGHLPEFDKPKYRMTETEAL